MDAILSQLLILKMLLQASPSLLNHACLAFRPIPRQTQPGVLPYSICSDGANDMSFGGGAGGGILPIMKI
jgi:hypothetical protein